MVVTLLQQIDECPVGELLRCKESANYISFGKDTKMHKEKMTVRNKNTLGQSLTNADIVDFVTNVSLKPQP